MTDKQDPDPPAEDDAEGHGIKFGKAATGSR
jgi:hypothetical protein